MTEVVRDWIVIHGSVVNTVTGGGFEYFGPFTWQEARKAQSAMFKPEYSTIMIQLLRVGDTRKIPSRTSREG